MVAQEQEVTDHDYRRIAGFLYHEARLLDARKLWEWFALLTEDVVYRVLAPTARPLEEPDRGHGVLCVDEDHSTLRTRITQLSNPTYTIAENPPFFTRRFVSNIEAARSEPEGRFTVSSNLLLYRSQGTQLPPYLFSAERQDVLLQVDRQWRLAERLVLLDEVVIGTRHLSVFF